MPFLKSLRFWWLRVLAILYLAALLAVLLGMRFVGERWWVTTALLYMPRPVFALPLPCLVAGLLWIRAFRWLATQIVALILLVPLLGFHVGWSRLPPAGSHPIRIFTMNVDLARASSDYVVNLVQQNQPDIVCLQETGGHPPTGLAGILPGFHIDQDEHFYLASRYPILSSEPAPVIMYNGHHRSLRFQHYRLQGPDGPLDVFNIHPFSPHEAFSEAVPGGVKSALRHGRILGARGRAAIVANAKLRSDELRAIAEAADQSPNPVLIMGDTNTPDLSWSFARWLGKYQDGFIEVGTGFGYTWPAHSRIRWLRLDRILANDRLRFLDARTAGSRLGDHLAVVATVVPRDKP
jgi:endonuclease/exonuclease/phosphatase (EEP) superfamily protein YafD